MSTGSGAIQFLAGELPGSAPEKFVVDLENCRITLPEDGVRELAYVSDELSKSYFVALNELERQWGAQYFPFVGKGSVMVAICTMPRKLWNTILAFAEDHDYGKGESEWHIFDAAHACLKPCTDRPHPLYDRGHHSILYARDEVEGLVYSDDVLIVWSPTGLAKEEIGQRNWWPCDYVFSWIEQQLLPEVGEWVFKNSKKRSLFARSEKRKFLDWWQRHAKIDDVRILPLAEGGRYRTLGLRGTVEKLQPFFHGYGDNQKIYFPANKLKDLYRALITVLQGGHGYAGYIAGNLSLERSCETHAEIIELLQERLLASEITSNSAVIDYRLRALLAALGDDDSWLSEPEREQVFNALVPLMEFYDQQMLMHRHSRWV